MIGHARNIMTERVVSVGEDATLLQIAETLVEAQIGGVPVVDAEEKVVGFVSESDLMDALLRDATGGRTRARQLMSAPAIVIDEFAPSDEVMEVLRARKVHHLPVVRAGRLVGIISPLDVLRYFVGQMVPDPPQAS